jgi:rhamnulokinase
MGLWLLQECQRLWAHTGHNPDYDTLMTNVDVVPAFAALIDPDDPRFLAPRDMPAAINAYLQDHNQAPLQTPVTFVRCIMESLVLRYCEVFQQIKELTGTSVERVHVLGGGARNTRLNQWLADALGVPVVAGPYEATAYGNALMQLVGLGELHTLQDIRGVAQGQPTFLFSPRLERRAAWDEAVHRFRRMTVGVK